VSGRVAVDVGGTFIDLVLLDEATGELRIEKQAAHPDALVDEVLNGLERTLDGATDVTRLIHGTTVGINALVQERGAQVGLITTSGFRDVLEMGRGRRREVHNSVYLPPTPLVPRYLRREVDGRIEVGGREVRPLDVAGVEREASYLIGHGVEAIAICFLNSYCNPSHERAAVAAIQRAHPDLAVTSSCEIVTEWREFERTSTAVVNAYVQPLMSRYLRELEAALGDAELRCSVAIMQSNGGVMTPAAASRRPVRTLESGPAGGVLACAALAEHMGVTRVICADVGGTTFDVALVEDGRVLEATETEVADRPILGSVIDIVSIGSGGGSIAWIDRAGAVQVGPRSAGAHPGPACFGRGGSSPTVTDCQLVLGRLNADYFLGARLKLDREAAEAAIRREVADQLGMGTEDAARGILSVAETNMAYGIRLMTVERGVDPRDFVLFSYGGGGGLFSVRLAEELDIGMVVVPRFPANFSALGLLTSDYRDDRAITHIETISPTTVATIYDLLAEVEREARRELEDFGFSGDDLHVGHRIDIRYESQDDTLTIPLADGWQEDPDLPQTVREDFERAHQRLYGYTDPSGRIEMVAGRCSAIGAVGQPPWSWLPPTARGLPAKARAVDFGDGEGYTEASIYRRDGLGVDHIVSGPAIIEEWTSTTLVPPGWSVRIDSFGSLVITGPEHP